MDSFKRRLLRACNEYVECPPPGRGQQTWLSEQVGISAQAASKWFSGKSEPSKDMYEKIGKALNVSPAWLSYGDDQAVVDAKVKKVTRHSNAVYACYARAAYLGWTFAPETEREGVDLVCFIDGEARDVSCVDLENLNQPEGVDFISVEEGANIYRGKTPPITVTSGFTVGVITSILKHTIQYRYIGFPSEQVQAYSLDQIQGRHYFVEVNGAENSMIAPIGSGLSKMPEPLLERRTDPNFPGVHQTGING